MASVAGFCKRYGIELFDYKDYRNSALEFGKLFPNSSTNGEVWKGRRRDFELKCYERWFVLHEFMTQLSIEKVFYGDADTMIYSNVTEVADKIYPDTDLALMYMPPRVSISFAIASVKGMSDMLQFITQTFLKWNDVFAPNVKAKDFHGHVNDMNVMKLWTLRRVGLANVHCVHMGVPPGDHSCLSRMYFSRARVVDHQPTVQFKTLANIKGGLLFDNNIGTDDDDMFDVLELPNKTEYNVPAFKRVKWAGSLGLPHFTLDYHKFVLGVKSPTGTRVQIAVAGMHFQGLKKKLMTFYMRDLKLKACMRHACSCVTMECKECVPDCDRSSIESFLAAEREDLID